MEQSLKKSDTIKISYILKLFGHRDHYPQKMWEERIKTVLLSMDAAKKINHLFKIRKEANKRMCPISPEDELDYINRGKNQAALRRKKKGEKYSEPAFKKNRFASGNVDNSDYYRKVLNDPFWNRQDIDF